VEGLLVVVVAQPALLPPRAVGHVRARRRSVGVDKGGAPQLLLPVRVRAAPGVGADGELAGAGLPLGQVPLRIRHLAALPRLGKHLAEGGRHDVRGHRSAAERTSQSRTGDLLAAAQAAGRHGEGRGALSGLVDQQGGRMGRPAPATFCCSVLGRQRNFRDSFASRIKLA
jgi:hypothetical protein